MSETKRSAASWTKTEEASLEEWFKMGYTDDRISMMTGRSSYGIKNKRRKLGLKRQRGDVYNRTARILALRKDGFTIKIIAEKVGTSIGTVCLTLKKNKQLFGDDVPESARMRKCLGPLCNGQREFFSEDPGIRICSRCRAHNRTVNHACAA